MYQLAKNYWRSKKNDVPDDPYEVVENINERLDINPWVLDNPYAIALVKAAYLEGAHYFIDMMAARTLQGKFSRLVELESWQDVTEPWQLTGRVKEAEGEVLPPYPSVELCQFIGLMEEAPCVEPWGKIRVAIENALDDGLWDGFITAMAELEGLEFGPEVEGE